MEKEEYRRMYEVEDRLWWYSGMRRIVTALLDRRYLPRVGSGIDILDAGCGTGANLLFLKRYGNVTGIDASEEAIRFCHERGLTNVQLAGVEKLPFKDCSFDLVTSFEVLYHASIQDDVAVLREFRRVLKPGGRLLLRLPAYNWLRGQHDLVVHTRHRYIASELRHKLRTAGYVAERTSYANMLLFPLAAVKRVFEMRHMHKQAGDTEAQSDLAMPPAVMNSVLRSILNAEAQLIRYINLPFGLSVITLARKE